MTSNTYSPIIALCSPRGSGAVALLRISGEGSFEVVDAMAKLSSKKSITACDTHTIQHGFVVTQDKSIIDEVLFLLMRGPRSFTGEDTIEITCHNNQFLIDAIMHRAIACGARLAQRGEFSQMAFANGKMDLVQAESLHEVICGETERAVKTAMAQLQGTLSSHMHTIEKELVDLLCMVEASFEFLDEEQRDLNFDDIIRSRLKKLKNYLEKITSSFALQEQIRQGVRIALIGTVNAGKSTLFNALLGKDRAIVTDRAGTTRDSIEATLHRDGNFWTLVDTAGLRSTDDIIEKQGIDRAYEEASKADIIMLVRPAGDMLCGAAKQIYEQLEEQYASKVIHVLSKSDLANNYDRAFDIELSAEHKTNIAQLEQLLISRVKDIFARHQSPYLLNKRQQVIIAELYKKIDIVEKDSTNRIECELVAYHVREALSRVSELTGKTINEKMLDTVFRSFCIGK